MKQGMVWISDCLHTITHQPVGDLNFVLTAHDPNLNVSRGIITLISWDLEVI